MHTSEQRLLFFEFTGTDVACRRERAWHCQNPKNGFLHSTLKPLPCVVKTSITKKMSLSFSISDTHTLSYQSLHTASLLTYCVSVLRELQAGRHSIDHPLFGRERQVLCRQQPDVTNSCNRAEEPKNTSRKKKKNVKSIGKSEAVMFQKCDSGCTNSKWSLWFSPFRATSLQERNIVTWHRSVHHIPLFLRSEVSSIPEKILLSGQMKGWLSVFSFSFGQGSSRLYILYFSKSACNVHLIFLHKPTLSVFLSNVLCGSFRWNILLYFDIFYICKRFSFFLWVNHCIYSNLLWFIKIFFMFENWIGSTKNVGFVGYSRSREQDLKWFLVLKETITLRWVFVRETKNRKKSSLQPPIPLCAVISRRQFI